MRLWFGGIQQRASAEKESTAARRADCDWFHWREAHNAAFLLHLSFLKILSGRLKRKQTQRALLCWSNILALSFHACKLKPAQASELRIKRRDQTLSRERWLRDYGDIIQKSREQQGATYLVPWRQQSSAWDPCVKAQAGHTDPLRSGPSVEPGAKKTVETTSFSSLPLHSVCSSLYHL